LEENFDDSTFFAIHKEKEMADFRRCLTALAVLVLLTSLAGTAMAQIPQGAFSCTASAAVPPLLRSEGLTELTGDVVLNCTGGTPTLATTLVPQANITVFLNTTVTSRLLGGSGSASEALLLVDEPGSLANPSVQTPCGAGNSTGGCTFPGTSTSTGIAGPEPFSGGSATLGGTTYTRANIFQGTVSANSVTFLGVPIDPPGTAGSRVYRITNVRANASAISAGAAGVPGQVVASIAISGSTSVPINNPIQIVGFVQSGLTFSVRKADNSDAISTSDLIRAQCVNLSRLAPFAVLRFSETFATSFKTRTAVNATGTEGQPAPVVQNVPGSIYNSETGFYNPALPGTFATAGLADSGTRLKAVFNNIPSGASIFVTTGNINQTAARLARLTGSEGGAFFLVPVTNTDITAFTSAVCVTAGCNTGVASLPVVNNTATATWEVLSSDPLSTQNYEFGLTFGFTAAPGTNSPAAGISTINGSFAPTPPSFSAADGSKAQGPSFPIPRFVDTSTGRNILNINVCRTNLLFPFVTNQAGFDTGLAISNTSTDPFGTTPQQGTCTLNMYGANAPAAVTTPVVASGTSYVNLTSSIAPNFQGYIIAVCQFQYAHGFAFVSDAGAQRLAMGYLALVLPDPGRQLPAITLAGGSGEVLGQ